MPKSLTELTTKEVSLVTRGAVNRRFAVKKDAAMSMILKAVLEQPAEGEAAALAALAKSGASDKGVEAAQAMYRLLAGFRDELPAEFVKAAPKMAGYEKATNDEAHDYAEGDGKFPGAKKSKAKKAKRPADDGDDDADEDDMGKDADGDDDGDEDGKFPPSKKKKGKTMKSADMPAELREQFEAVAKAQQEAVEKAERIEKELKVERDLRLTKEFVEKAHREFGNVGPATEVGAVLKSLHAVDGKLAAQVEGLLKGAAARVSTSNLFGERGRDSSLAKGGDTAWGRIEKAAEELVNKSADGKVTKAQAIDIVMKRQPELYEEYKAENNHFRVGGR